MNRITSHTLPIIGYHHSPLSQKFGVPRQPNLVAVKSHIDFVAPYAISDAFVGIERYSHLWILWLFHHNKGQANFRPQVRPPRLGGNEKIGVFATRSMYRPSAIGLSVVQFDRLEVIDNQVILHIIGADMVDGTPILDIKPYLAFADSVSGAKGFSKPTVRSVLWSNQAETDFMYFLQSNALRLDDQVIITKLIAQDPRVAYRQHETNLVSVMQYRCVDINFYMNDDGAMVIECIKNSQVCHDT